MRSGDLFFSLTALLFSFFVALIGLVFLFVPYFPSLLEAVLEGISQPHFFIWIGCGCLALGSVLLTVFFAAQRRNYWLIQMGENHSAAIENSVFQSVVCQCFQKTFPGKDVKCAILFKKRKIEIVADVPLSSLEEQEVALERLEIDLKKAFVELCGYTQPFLLNIQFSEI